MLLPWYVNVKTFYSTLILNDYNYYNTEESIYTCMLYAVVYDDGRYILYIIKPEQKLKIFVYNNNVLFPTFKYGKALCYTYIYKVNVRVEFLITNYYQMVSIVITSMK